MNNKKRWINLSIYCLVFLLSLVTSCSKDDIDNQDKKEPTTEVTLEVELPKEANVSLKLQTSPDTRRGIKEEWTKDDKLIVYYQGLYGKEQVELRAKSVNGKLAIFSGEIPSRSLSSYKKNPILAINKVKKLQSDYNSYTIDFTEQNGTVEGLANYDLLSATGRGSDKKLCFTQQFCVLRLDLKFPYTTYQKLTGFSMNFNPRQSVPTVNNMLLSSSIKYKVQNTLSKTSEEPLTFFEMNNLNKEIIDGKTSVYIILPEKRNLSGTLSIEANVDGNTTYRKYINISNKTFGANQVQAKLIAFKDPQEKVANVCDYLYNDGTWGPLKDYGYQKYPVALVFSNQTSDDDRQQGFTHGYAVALNPASINRTHWENGSDDEPFRTYPGYTYVLDNTPQHFPELAILRDLNGLKNSNIVYPYLKNYSFQNYNNSRYRYITAVPAAREYGTEAWRVFNGKEMIVPKPPRSSNWFLPSLGQMFLIYTNVAKLDKERLTASGDEHVIDYLSWSFNTEADARKVSVLLENYFSTETNPILKKYYEREQINSSSFFSHRNPFVDNGVMSWSSTLKAFQKENALAVVFNNDLLEYTLFNKRSSYGARAIIAF